MRTKILALAVAVAGAALALPAGLLAQPNVASINANATVLTPLTVTGAADLDFGSSVFPGVAASVLPTDPTAGQFDILGNGTAEVDLDFGTLPSALAGSGTAAGDNLAISFGSSDAGHGTSQAAQTAFDPNSGDQPRLVAGQLSVWVGGTVTPRVDQTAGPYSSSITLTVNYTGN